MVWFGAYPFANTILLSFTDAPPLGGGSSFVGFDNYTAMLGDEAFWDAALNSVLYMVIATPLLVVLPLLLAVLVERKVPLIGIFRTAFYVPVLTSVVVAGIAWQFLLKDDGLVNGVLQKVQVLEEPLPFLTDRWLLLLSCVAVTVWKGLGWYMVLYLAALANVDKSQNEAATLDGASAAQRLWHITVPAIKPVILLVATLSAAGSLRVFTEIYMLGGSSGGPGGSVRTLPFLIRDAGLDPVSGNAGYGAALSTALFLLTFAVALLSRMIVREEQP
ncbi:carbohydrate ABC transporter permease [Streptomyces coerulescens]|uniref:Carbohydrate ABC transporter permease n=1 Tax=Streptomyces coerulescens TaxID=29304 RepID=A0ABW0CXK2_STRCD